MKKELCRLSFAVASTVAVTLNAHADNCEVIRQAIRQVPPAGGTILLQESTYECTSMIVIDRSDVKLKGAGQGKTTLRLADNSASPVLVIGDAKMKQNEKGEWIPATRVKNVVVSDLTIDGNRAHQDPSQECGNHSCNGDVSSIRNNGITIRGASDITIENVTSHSSVSGGLVTEKYCERLNVKNFTSYGHYFDGFAGYQTQDSVFENLDLSRNRAAGISLDLDFSRNRFVNAKLEMNGDVGIFARDVRGLLFENFDIVSSGNHGAFMSASEGGLATCASDNEFRSVRFVNSKGYGFHLADACKGNRLTGQTVFTQNQGGCYYAAPGSDLTVEKSVRCQ